jgi:hypothetical protein
MLAHEIVSNWPFEDIELPWRSIKPGDHIIVKRILGIYTHHGPYIGGGKVIHYQKHGGVQQSTLRSFRMPSLRLYVRRYKSVDVDFSQAIQRAKSRLSENRYALLYNNCEHFVEWCLVGTPHSYQIEGMPEGDKLALIAATSGIGR